AGLIVGSIKGSRFSRVNCANVIVASGRLLPWLVERRQFAGRLRASLLETWLTGPSTFERSTLLKELSGRSTVSRQRATHIFWPFPLIVKQPFWNLRRITVLLSVIRPLVPASAASVARMSSGLAVGLVAGNPYQNFRSVEAPILA